MTHWQLLTIILVGSIAYHSSSDTIDLDSSWGGTTTITKGKCKKTGSTCQDNCEVDNTVQPASSRNCANDHPECSCDEINVYDCTDHTAGNGARDVSTI